MVTQKPFATLLPLVLHNLLTVPFQFLYKKCIFLYDLITHRSRHTGNTYLARQSHFFIICKFRIFTAPFFCRSIHSLLLSCRFCTLDSIHFVRATSESVQNSYVLSFTCSGPNFQRKNNRRILIFSVPSLCIKLLVCLFHFQQKS